FGTGFGGGLLNEGTATVLASTFTANTSTGGGGGYGTGGGVANFGPSMTIRNSTFSHNLAIDGLSGFATGGAVDNETGGTMALDHVVFTDNQALGSSTQCFGGALENFEATISVSNCTFTGNLASGKFFAQGGAFDNDGPATL